MRALRTPLTVALLTLLADRPRHPYEMKTMLTERHIGAVVKLRGGSLYDAIARLSTAGLIEPVETIRDGPRPDRTVYAIADAGRETLRSLLREYLGIPAREYPVFVTGLAHILVLDRAEATDLLRQRAAAVGAEHDRTTRLLAEQAGELPRVVLLEADYTQAIRVAELTWLEGVIADLESGSIAWITDTADTAEPDTDGTADEEYGP